MKLRELVGQAITIKTVFPGGEVVTRYGPVFIGEKCLYVSVLKFELNVEVILKDGIWVFDSKQYGKHHEN